MIQYEMEMVVKDIDRFKMAVTAVATLLLLALLRQGESALPTSTSHESNSQLPKAHGSPLNIDPKVDCALKQLAWEYAKRLLPKVLTVQSKVPYSGIIQSRNCDPDGSTWSRKNSWHVESVWYCIDYNLWV